MSLDAIELCVSCLCLNSDTDSPDPGSTRKSKGKSATNGLGKHDETENGLNSPTSDSSDPAARKPVLSEEQKKANHIQSEQKRREKIREQYDKLAELTPGMEGQGRSEGRVLEEAVKFAETLRKEREKLIAEVEMLGGVIDPTLKKY